MGWPTICHQRGVAIGTLSILVSMLSTGSPVTPASADPLPPATPSFEHSSTLAGTEGAAYLSVDDFDGDGHDDLLTAPSTSTIGAIALSTGPGSFVTGPIDLGATPLAQPEVGLIDDDAHLDLVVPATTGTVVLLGRGDGTFQAATTVLAVETRGVALGDLDGDGATDLATIHSSSPTLRLLRGAGDGTFSQAGSNTGTRTRTDVAIADVNGDGDLDVALGEYQTTGIGPVLPVLATWTGNGDFTLAVSQQLGAPGFGFVRQMVADDLDHDGSTDIVVGADQSISVARGLGDGSLALPAGISGASCLGRCGLDAADVNLDGLDDIVVGGGGTMSVAFAQLGQTFVHRRYASTAEFASGVLDVDHDGRPEIIAVPSPGPIEVLTLDGDRLMAPQSIGVSSARVGAGLATHDLDADGDDDLVAVGTGGITTVRSTPLGLDPVPSELGRTGLNGSVAVGSLAPSAPPSVVVGTSAGIATVPTDGQGNLGTATATSLGARVTSVALADLDGDDVLDLALTQESGDSVKVLPGTGAGGFGAPVGYPAGNHPVDIAAADIDGDDDIDLVVVNTSQPTYQVLRNQGDGTFDPAEARPLPSGGTHLAVADLDEDGHVDLAISRGSGSDAVIDLHVGAGDGTFVETSSIPFGAVSGPSTGTNPPELSIADLNGDGHLDLLTSGAGVSLGDGTGQHTSVVLAPNVGHPDRARAIDVDGDGHLDLVGSRSTSSIAAVLASAPSDPVPSVTTQPADASVPRGNPASFIAAATGDEPTVQWQRSDDDGPWTDIAGATAEIYTLPSTLPSDDGARFRAVFTNVHGSTPSAPATLTVRPMRVLAGGTKALEPDSGTMGMFLPITLNAPAPSDITIRYYTRDGSATGTFGTSGDYRRSGTAGQPAAIKIPAGQTWNAVAISVLADAVDEGDEDFELVLVSVTAADGSAVEIGDGLASATIVDDGDVGTDSVLYVTDTMAYESDTSSVNARAQVALQFSRPVATGFTLTYSTIDGTAIGGPRGSPGADYRKIEGSMFIPAGTVGSRVIDIGLWGDVAVEDHETFQVRVVLPDGVPVIQRDPLATAWILNDD